MNTENPVTIFGDFGGNDFASTRASDLILPRLVLLQSTHEQVKAGKGLYMQWLNSTTEEVVAAAREKFKVIPLMYWNEWIEWNPNRAAPKKDKVLSRSIDPNSREAKIAASRETVKDNKGKDVFRVTEYYHFLVVLPNEDVALLSFSRAAHFIGKQFLNKLMMIRVSLDGGATKVNPPLGVTEWELSSEEGQNDAQEKYARPVIGAGGLVDKSRWAWLAAKKKFYMDIRAQVVAQNSDVHTDVEPEPTTAPDNM